MIIDHQRGSVIIIVLWTVTMLTILVTVLASEVRLSAKAAYYHQQGSRDWANVMAAVSKAEMELLLERMPKPISEDADLSQDAIDPEYRFNGQALELHYPAAGNIVVRVYSHAGKINLRRLQGSLLRSFLENKLGQDMDPTRLEELMGAWNDWKDRNDLMNINGAEKDYYQSLETPYSPRNAQIETVEEVLLIRGFRELFADVNLDAAFTLYGNTHTVNLNFATREAMELLPGLDDELIDEIILRRRSKKFRNRADVSEIVPFEKMQDLSRWIGNSTNTSDYYTIVAYPRLVDDSLDNSDNHEDRVTHAYAQTVQIESNTSLPKVLKINPFAKLPIRPALASEEDTDYDL